MSEHGPPSVEKKVVDLIIGVLVALCVGFTVADFFYDKHGHYDFEHWPGFHSFYGFVACVGLVLAARVLRKLIMRDEDYYDDE
jgi:hypothetical protein